MHPAICQLVTFQNHESAIWKHHPSVTATCIEEKHFYLQGEIIIMNKDYNIIKIIE
jgi:hypothetical protein